MSEQIIESPQDDVIKTIVEQRRKWLQEMRGWMMLVTTIVATMTYQAGLNPPGGFWQDDPVNGSHHASDPALDDKHHSRYLIFYYFNSTAFMTSLVIMALLIFYDTEAKMVALMATTFVGLASLIGAYVAGTTRYFAYSICIIVVTCVAFVSVIYVGEVMTEVYFYVRKACPCLQVLEAKRWFPIPAEVVVKARKREAEMRRHKAEMQHHRARRERSSSEPASSSSSSLDFELSSSRA